MNRHPHAPRTVLLAALTVAYAVPAVARAQVPRHAFDAATSARALALGDAFPLGTGGSDALFYGAAAGDAFRGISVGAGRRGGETALAMSGGVAWWQGRVAAGVVALDRGGAAASTGLGVAAAYAREIAEDLTVSAGARVLQSRTSADRRVAGGLDVAASYRIEDAIWLGVSARGLGASRLGDPHVLDPSVALMAASDREAVGPLDVLGAATIRTRSGGPLEAGAGLEVSWWPIAGRTFAGRIGAHWIEAADPSLTLGAGFEGDQVIVEYAWDRAVEAHRVGLAWRLEAGG